MSDPPTGEHTPRYQTLGEVGEVRLVYPILGTRDLSEYQADLINSGKVLEESVMRVLDTLIDAPGVDTRSWSLARTNLQTGFMWLERAVTQPKRLTDEEYPHANRRD